jgi:glycosyltransferase involved in cell wall biosynthesis
MKTAAAVNVETKTANRNVEPRTANPTVEPEHEPGTRNPEPKTAPMRRVLMVSPHFPPDTNAGAHRVRLLAPYLPAFGWQPTVISVDPTSYEGRLDPDLARLVPESVRVVRVPAWKPGLTRCVGFGDLGLRALTAIRRACDAALARERYDALFITIYPTYPALLGPGLKRRHRIPFVLDYQDPWVSAWGRDVGPGVNGTPDLRSRLTRVLSERLEPRVVRAADALTAVSARTYEDVLDRVPDARPRACAAIPLGFDEEDLAALARAPRPNPCFDEGDGLVHVCYVGTVLPKGGDVLEAVLRGLAFLRTHSPARYARLRLHFVGTSNQRTASADPRVLPVARALGVADAITETPSRLDYLDALNVQSRAHAVLLMGSTEPHYTPSKVFPALLAQRPILALYHDASSVIDVLTTPGVDAQVITFGDDRPVETRVGDIARAFDTLASRRPTRAVPAAREALAPWSARTLAGQLAGVLDTVTRLREP